MSTEIYLQRVPDAARIYNVSEAEYYSRAVRGLVPAPFKIGIRASRVPSNETAAVSLALIAGKSDAEILKLVAELKLARAAQFTKFLHTATGVQPEQAS